MLPWVEFVALRRDFLRLLADATGHASQEHLGTFVPCLDDGPGEVEYSGGPRIGLTARLDGCSQEESVAYGDRLLAVAEKALTHVGPSP